MLLAWGRQFSLNLLKRPMSIHSDGGDYSRNSMYPFQADSTAKRQLVACLWVNGLMSLPIILYIPQYMDDYIRSYSGQYGWVANLRPLGELLYRIINLGPPATSAGPLYLLLSLLIGSAVNVMIARSFGVRSPFWTALATLPVLGQPYFLQNLSFNFDGILMTSGLCLALLAALAAKESRTALRSLTSILILLTSLFFYQAASSAFLAISGAYVMADWLGIPSANLNNNRTRKFRPDLLKRVIIVYAAATGMCAGLAKIPLISQDAYTASNSQIILSLASLAQSFTSNLKVQIGVFIRDWVHSPGGIIFAFCLLVCSLMLALLILRDNLRNHQILIKVALLSATSVLISILLISILVLSPGAMYLIKQSHAGTPRTNIFVGPWLASLNLLTLSAIDSTIMKNSRFALAYQSVSRSAIVLMAWLILVFSFTYGSAIYAQTELQKIQMSRILGAVSLLRQQKGESQLPNNFNVNIIGPVPRSPALLNTTKKFPLINQLIPSFGLPELTWHGLSNVFPEVPWYGLYGAVQSTQSELIYERQSLGSAEATCTPSAGTYCSSDFEAKVSGDTLFIKLR